MSAGNCAVLIFSTRTWTTRSARSCQTALVEKPIWPKRSLLVLRCQSVRNSLIQPSSSGMFNSSYELILFFSSLINNWIEEKQWDVEHYIYLDFRAFLCLAAKSLQNRDTGKKWIRLTLTSPKHPDSRFGVSGLYYKCYKWWLGGSPVSVIIRTDGCPLGSEVCC